mmetsp:Transcript_56506/g.148583  ORF Transcript_56506/g.148583 Transcript_56506/m.148583 type:complete len:308 (-) Transcript_56506:477-1400(-)
MLPDVDEAQPAVGPQLARAGGQPAGHQGEERGFAGAVPPDDGHAVAECDLHRDVFQHGPVGALVLERHIRQFQHHGVLGCLAAAEVQVARDPPGVWEDQLVRRLAHVQGQRVGLAGRVLAALAHSALQELLGLGFVASTHFRFEGLEVALVVVQLRVLGEVDDVGADAVEEVGVVRDDHGRAALLPADAHPVDEAHEPPHSFGVQVVGGLVQEQQAGLLRHRAGQSQAHLPPATERPHGFVEHLLAVEADLAQGVLELGLRGPRAAGVLQLGVRPRGGLRLHAPEDRLVPQVDDADVLREAHEVLAG